MSWSRWFSFRCRLWARLLRVPGTFCFQSEWNKVVSNTQMFVFFLFQAALSAAASAFVAVDVMWDWANVSGTVAFHANGLPCDQGINVAPSGRLPSDLDSPTGSLHAGTCASWWPSREWHLLENVSRAVVHSFCKTSDEGLLHQPKSRTRTGEVGRSRIQDDNRPRLWFLRQTVSDQRKQSVGRLASLRLEVNWWLWVLLDQCHLDTLSECRYRRQ